MYCKNKCSYLDNLFITIIKHKTYLIRVFKTIFNFMTRAIKIKTLQLLVQLKNVVTIAFCLGIK